MVIKMNKKYLQLFKELARSLELLAERAIEEEKDNVEENKVKTAILMHENYMNIYNKIHDNKIEQLTLSDFAHLYIASGVLINQFESKKKSIELALRGYKVDILPKINRILNETKTDSDALALAKELFSEEVEK